MLNFFWGTIAEIIISWPGLVDRLISRAKKTPYLHIHARTGNMQHDAIYMYRYWLFNPYDRETNIPKYSWFPWSIRLHHIVLPDSDEHMHDHPWNARTLILRGGYIEKLPEPLGTNVMVPGKTRAIKFNEYHKIDFVSGSAETWTLFISGPWQGVWGFMVNGVKIPWKKYLGFD